jgi:hypothetical protein
MINIKLLLKAFGEFMYQIYSLDLYEDLYDDYDETTNLK